jgi:hypothetical protein
MSDEWLAIKQMCAQVAILRQESYRHGPGIISFVMEYRQNQ